MSSLILTLYSHNLNESHKSFANDLTLADFKSNLKWEIKDAHRIVYVNPRGEVVVLKEHRKKVGVYDWDN